MASSYLVAMLTGVALLLSACSSDDVDDADETVASSRPATSVDTSEELAPSSSSTPDAAVSAESVETFSSSEVCALVPEADVAAALGVETVTAEPVEGGRPQCLYEWSDGSGAVGGAVLGVPRPIEDLGGKVGEAGLEEALETSGLLVAEPQYQELDAIGDGAVWLSVESSTLLAAWEDDQVVMVASSALTQEESAALTARLLGAIR